MSDWSTERIKRNNAPDLHSRWLPALNGNPTVLFVHGSAEYGARYTELQEWLHHQNGLGMIQMDLRGHGKSEGKPGFIRDISEYLDDVQAVWEEYDERLKGPLWLLGHSMGGLIVLRLRQTRVQQVPAERTYALCPFLGIRKQVPAWKKQLSKGIVKLLPGFSLPSGLKGSEISRDPAVQHAYDTDPTISRKVSAAWFEAILQAQAQTLADAPKTVGPLYVFYSAADQIVDSAATERFADRVPADRIQRTRYAQYAHEMHNDLEKEVFWDDLRAAMALD